MSPIVSIELYNNASIPHPARDPLRVTSIDRPHSGFRDLSDVREAMAAAHLFPIAVEGDCGAS